MKVSATIMGHKQAAGVEKKKKDYNHLGTEFCVIRNERC